CWRKQALPERWHYGMHPRVPAIVCQADDGWIVARRPPADSDWRPPTHMTGAHGFDPASPEMRAVFVADGPSFAAGVTMAPFANAAVYPLLTRRPGVPAEPTDGDAASFGAVLAPTAP